MVQYNSQYDWNGPRNSNRISGRKQQNIVRFRMETGRAGYPGGYLCNERGIDMWDSLYDTKSDKVIGI